MVAALTRDTGGDKSIIFSPDLMVAMSVFKFKFSCGHLYDRRLETSAVITGCQRAHLLIFIRFTAL